MNAEHVQRLRQLHIKALETQRQHMQIVRDSHQDWMLRTDDMAVRLLRGEIIDLIAQTIDQYDQLLKVLRKENGEQGGHPGRESGVHKP